MPAAFTRRILLLPLGVALLAVACSGGDDGGESDPPADQDYEAAPAIAGMLERERAPAVDDPMEWVGDGREEEAAAARLRDYESQVRKWLRLGRLRAIYVFDEELAALAQAAEYRLRLTFETGGDDVVDGVLFAVDMMREALSEVRTETAADLERESLTGGPSRDHEAVRTHLWRQVQNEEDVWAMIRALWHLGIEAVTSVGLYPGLAALSDLEGSPPVSPAFRDVMDPWFLTEKERADADARLAEVLGTAPRLALAADRELISGFPPALVPPDADLRASGVVGMTDADYLAARWETDTLLSELLDDYEGVLSVPPGGELVQSKANLGATLRVMNVHGDTLAWVSIEDGASPRTIVTLAIRQPHDEEKDRYAAQLGAVLVAATADADEAFFGALGAYTEAVLAGGSGREELGREANRALEAAMSALTVSRQATAEQLRGVEPPARFRRDHRALVEALAASSPAVIRTPICRGVRTVGAFRRRPGLLLADIAGRVPALLSPEFQGMLGGLYVTPADLAAARMRPSPTRPFGFEFDFGEATLSRLPEALTPPGAELTYAVSQGGGGLSAVASWETSASLSELLDYYRVVIQAIGYEGWTIQESLDHTEFVVSGGSRVRIVHGTDSREVWVQLNLECVP